MNNISYPKSMLEEKDNGEREFHWININTRTPHENGEYLVTCTNNCIELVSYTIIEGFYDYMTGYPVNITAWAKIPKPYKTNKL